MDRKTEKYILNLLRQGTITWSGRSEALRRSRKKVMEKIHDKTGKEKWKFYWQCSKCFQWFRNETEMQVDHIIEVGPFTGDWNKHISTLYCDLSNLQVLCISCHLVKTSKFNATLLYRRKNVQLKEGGGSEG
jgi:hypothetical protein